MSLFRQRDTSADRRRMVDELETLLKRALLLPVVLPVLVLAGWGLGEATTRGISLPGDAPIRIAEARHTATAQLEALSGHMRRIRNDGVHTEEYVRLYANHVRPVEAALEVWGVGPELARRVAWPLVEHSYARDLDPATVVAIVVVESSGLPTATSFVGARGLMQVMPIHEGHWGCGSDLYDIHTNLCYGTRILASNLRRFRGDERRALLAYNGCVNGTNTPNCHTYPDKVHRIRDRVRAEWRKVAPQSFEASFTGAAPRAGAAAGL